MMIDPKTHLLLHRQQQDERDRRLGHLVAIRTTGATADVDSATNPAMPSPWLQLLRSGPRLTARGSPTC